MGSLITGLGFGNSSTTLGHALSYVFSNEGISHGHALAYTTTIAHKFNNSIFYERFLEIVKKLNFQSINLKQNLDDAAELILLDKSVPVTNYCDEPLYLYDINNSSLLTINKEESTVDFTGFTNTGLCHINNSTARSKNK